MSQRLNSFLGGSPLAVAVRLILLSVLVGVLFSWLGWSARDILDWTVDLFRTVWDTLFGSLDRAVEYFIIGAAIVIPLFIISRVLKLGRN